MLVDFIGAKDGAGLPDTCQILRGCNASRARDGQDRPIAIRAPVDKQVGGGPERGAAHEAIDDVLQLPA